MAIMDTLGHFSTVGTPYDATNEAGTDLIPNQIDLSVIGRDPGAGQPVYLNFVVTTAFTDGGDAATLSLRLRSDSTASIHATTSTGHITTPPLLKAALVLNDKFTFILPPGSRGNTYEQFLGVQAVIATAGFDAGSLEVWLGHDPLTSNKTYADATN